MLFTSHGAISTLPEATRVKDPDCGTAPGLLAVGETDTELLIRHAGALAQMDWVFRSGLPQSPPFRVWTGRPRFGHRGGMGRREKREARGFAPFVETGAMHKVIVSSGGSGSERARAREGTWGPAAVRPQPGQ